MLPRDRQVGVDVGAVLNLPLGQRHIEAPGFPVRMDHRNSLLSKTGRPPVCDR